MTIDIEIHNELNKELKRFYKYISFYPYFIDFINNNPNFKELSESFIKGDKQNRIILTNEEINTKTLTTESKRNKKIEFSNNKLLIIFEKIEKIIINEEDLIIYEFPTFYFYFDDIMNYCNNNFDNSKHKSDYLH